MSLEKVDGVNGYLISHSHASLKIIKEISNETIQKNYGGFEFLIDKKNLIVFFFHW
jgi:hypothetical protein